MQQITTASGKNLLVAGEYLGGEIRARIEGEWVDNRSAEVGYYTGPVCDIIERSGSVGGIPVKESYYFFKEKPYIKAEIEFEFDGNEVGNMWIDRTKINIYYPTDGSEIYHDIPFGFVEARQKRPLFATNWLYSGGLVYVNRGTTKHWIQEGAMANMIAWGSNHFTNRMHWEWWVGRPQYDLRLYGKQKVEYYLIPCDEFDPAAIIHEVDNIIAPVFLTPGKGEQSFYQVGNRDLEITAVYPEEGGIWMRGYKIPSADKSMFGDFEIFNKKWNDIR
jgi:hypothetical protein